MSMQLMLLDVMQGSEMLNEPKPPMLQPIVTTEVSAKIAAATQRVVKISANCIEHYANLDNYCSTGSNGAVLIRDFHPRVDSNFTATDAPAGSCEKIDILARRLEAGYPLWHPHDRDDYHGLVSAIRPS